MTHDFILEKRLAEQAPDLHRRLKDSVLVLQKTLESFLNWFPSFTDHSSLHSMDVLDLSNRLLDKQIEQLSAAECYVLIMSCYLHDVGMGVNRKDYEAFTKELDLSEYRKKKPDADEACTIRDFHHELSGLFIRKYADLFEIPTEDLLHAIIQVSRGHRKTDLFDEREYPDLRTDYGIVRTAYLAAVLRLADEIDVGADRNPELLFDPSSLTRQADIDAFGTHESVRTVVVNSDRIVLRTKPKETRFISLIDDLAGKIRETLNYCREVAKKRSDLRITQERVDVEQV